MAKPEVTVFIRAKDLTATVIGRFRRRMRAMTTTIKNMTRAVVAGTVALVGMVFGLQKLGQQGDKVSAVKRAFARTTDDETAALKRLREAARGTVDDFKLMSLSNQALALGAAKSTEEFAEQIEVVRKLSRAQGLAVDEGLEKFTVGMARLSRLRLDDLGIQVEQGKASKRFADALGRTVGSLTEAERATAFRNEAMRQAIDLADRLAGKENAGAEAANRFATAMVNLKNRAAEFVAESPEVTEFFDRLTDVVVDLTEIVSGDADVIKEAFTSLGKIAGNAFSVAMLQVVRTLPDLLREVVSDVTGARALGNTIADMLPGDPAGPGPGEIFNEKSFQRTIDRLLGNLEAEVKVLETLAERARTIAEGRGAGAGGGGGGFGRGDAPTAALAFPGLTGPAINQFVNERFRENQARRQRARLSPFGEPTIFDVSPLQAPDGPRQFDGVTVASDAMKEAGEVATAAMFGTAAAIVAGSEQIEASIINMVTNILRSLPGVGGLTGALIGGVGGLFGAFLGRSKGPVPVRLAGVDDAAARKLATKNPPGPNITYIINGQELSIEEIAYELRRRSRLDAISRLPPPPPPRR